MAEQRPLRDTIFISHANPEDNTFALWLTLRLGELGYRVWCDLTKLIGGEVFWDDAEAAIRQRAVKFVYVLSTTSNGKDGPLRELQLAQAVAKSQALENFVIPARIDELRYEDTTIELQRLLNISFRPSWAQGLAQLLRRLELDGIVANASSGPSAISAWWRAHRSANQGVTDRPDEYVSNVFPALSWPTQLHVHELTRDSVGKVEVPGDCKVPFSQDGAHAISFASAAELGPALGSVLRISRSSSVSCAGWHERGCPQDWGRHVSRILRLAWKNLLLQRGLPVHMFANQVEAMYFRSGTAEGDVVGYDWGSGRSSNRQVVGYKTVTNLKTGLKSKRHWHYAIDARPQTYPEVAFLIRGHALFSDDGRSIWDDPKKLLSARASQCKNWWNPAWRDRLLGSLNWLAEGEPHLSLPLASGAVVQIGTTPLTYESAASYDDPGDVAWADDDDVRDTDEDADEPSVEE